jgi:hypothetical protein
LEKSNDKLEQLSGKMKIESFTIENH